MGTAGVKVKLMPTSPEIDLQEIEKKAKKVIEEQNGKNCRFNTEPIAFGLKALILFFEWPEEKELSEVENKLKQIENLNSVQVLDMRRLI
jgi:elongation factor 1-beta